MIGHIAVKMSDYDKANKKAALEIANALTLGWQVLSRKELYQDGKYCIVVWITPRKEE